MTSTSSEATPGSLREPTSLRRSESKRKRKEGDDYQAEVTAVEKAQDQRDPDWPGTQDTDQVGSSSKRRKNVPVLAVPSAITNTPTARSSHKLYVDCSPGTRRKRDSHLSRIEKNWGEPKNWMPESIWPSIRNKSAEQYERQLLEDTRDWSETLLERLAHLSDLLSDAPERAYLALEEAVMAMDRKEKGPQICKNDVKRVIEQIRSSEATDPAPPTAFPEPPVETSDTTLEEALIDGRASNERIAQLPSPRSPTRGRGPRIKEEFQSLTAVRTPVSVAPGGVDSARAESCEVEVISQSEWRRRRKKLKLFSNLKRNRLQQEEVEIQQQLWALEDADETD